MQGEVSVLCRARQQGKFHCVHCVLWNNVSMEGVFVWIANVDLNN